MSRGNRLLLLVLLALPWPRPVQAQLIPCKENATGNKLYLDDARARAVDDASHVDTLIQRLNYKLTTNLRSLEKRKSPGMKMLSCVARYPKGEGDFTPTLSQSLTTEKVVLEVWSAVDREMDDGGEVFSVVEVSIALLPMVALRTPGAPSGVVQLELRCLPGEPVKLALRRLDIAEALWGLARVAIGLREYSLMRDGPAISALCEGARVLRTLKNQAHREGCAAIADHADEMTERAHERLRQLSDIPTFVSAAATCEVSQ